MPYAKIQVSWFAIGLLAALVGAIVNVLSGHAIKYLTDSALAGTLQWSATLALLLIALIAVGVIVKFLAGISFSRFSLYTVRGVRSDVSRRIPHFQLAEVENRTGVIVSKLTSDMNVMQNFLLHELPQYFYNILVFLIAFGYLCILNWQLTFAAVASVPLSLILMNLLSKPLGKYARNEQEGKDAMASIVQDATNGIYIEKAYILQETMNAKFELAVKKVLDFSLLRQRRTSYLNPLQVVVLWLPLVTVAVYGGFLAFYGDLSTGSLFAFIFLLHYIVEPISGVLGFITELRGANVSAERVTELLTMSGERASGHAPTPDPVAPAIEFAEVSFGYSDHQPVLHAVSFEIPAGRTVAFVGESGSGKSTIFKLMCGFYQPQSGVIRLHGNDLSASDLASWREQLSLVSQDAYLFPGTIEENIAYGDLDATQEEVTAAARMANAHDFIMQLPEGYQSIVGERGILLSGGQRQRLALARAFLKDTQVLLLDEPTSALDVHSEALIQDALEKGMNGRTVLVIAHRLSTIRNADIILVMRDGRVVEHGNHEQLMALNGYYQQLYSQNTSMLASGI